MPSRAATSRAISSFRAPWPRRKVIGRPAALASTSPSRRTREVNSVVNSLKFFKSTCFCHKYPINPRTLCKVRTVPLKRTRSQQCRIPVMTA